MKELGKGSVRGAGRKRGKPSLVMKMGDEPWLVPIAAAPSFITDRLPALIELTNALALQGFQGTINLPNARIEIL
jgi:hypothetical protein